MKRFLMFLVIAIAVVSLGLTIYYFSTDNEVIYIKSSYLVVEKGDYIQAEGENGLLEFKHRSEHTTLSYGLQQEDHEDETKNVLSYNEEGYYLAMNGGESKIVITTNNRNYSKLIIDVLVCDGSVDYPYMVRTEDDLRKVGVEDPNADDTLLASEYSYKLANDIELTQPWNPIPSFKGMFDGNHFTISNMEVTNSSSLTDAGFVSILESTGVIKNLFLTNININLDKNYIGAFAGTSYGLIQTSEADGVIVNTSSGKSSYVGGVAGRLIDSTAKIDRCGFAGTIKTTGTAVVAGGVAGSSNGAVVSETYFRGIVENGESIFGGIVGYNESKVNAPANIYDSYFYLTKEEAKTIKDRIYGIAYKNVQTNGDNMVTGCYYGGSADTNLSTIAKSEDAIDSQANGYLTAENFYTKNKFITTLKADGNNRLWNFNSVWEIPNSSKYPVLNVFSSVGSTYIIDVSDIVTGTDITTAQQLYDVLSGHKDYTEETYKIANDIKMDANGAFVWGDATHPIPDSFNKQLINGTTTDDVTGEERPCIISGLTIENSTVKGDVGLVKRLGANAVISGLVIDNVTIQGEEARDVGVIAGVSAGASIYNVKITTVNVNIKGETFGTIAGWVNKYDGHGIKDVTVKYVDLANGYFKYAGGIAGVNLGAIDSSAESNIYNYIFDINLVAHYAGGMVGANGGQISHTTATDVQFNAKQNATTINTVYSGAAHVYVGGAVGVNEIIVDSNRKKGAIADVYTNINIVAQTGAKYNLYLGGVAGFNSSSIDRAYVTQSTITVTGSQAVIAGGIVGYNSGKISHSVVDKDCKISTSITASVPTTTSNNNYLLNTSNCSLVGGIAGYDALTSTSTYSIYKCATFMSEIKGYYAGGITGVSFGELQYSFCGDSTKVNGGVSITGYLSGGISSVIAGGSVLNCYSFASLNSAPYSGKYSDVLSVVKMEVSAMGGIAVFVLNKGTLVQGCYVVTTFNGSGVSYGSSADLTGYECGSLKNCVYQNSGSISTNYGRKLTANQLTGGDSYKAFSNAIGGGANTIWDLDTSSAHYPTLEDVSVRFPSSLPVFH